MIIPFLEALKCSNPNSVLGYTKDNEMRVSELHVFPGIMNRALKYIRPVVSLDAAHLKSVFKGTLFVASVLTGSNDHIPGGLYDFSRQRGWQQLAKDASIAEGGLPDH
jgi:hypothetical protein